MSKIYVALGSNLDEPSEQIYKAINSIDAVDDLSVTHISSLYKTKPIGKIDQPDFINAVIEVEGDISPENLHAALQAIETQAGRIRIELNEPRTLDLDILLIDDLNDDFSRNFMSYLFARDHRIKTKGKVKKKGLQPHSVDRRFQYLQTFCKWGRSFKD